MMNGVMVAKNVKEELKKMAGAGLVVLEGDTVGCGQRHSPGEGGNGGIAGAGSGEAVDGGRAVRKRKRRERRGDGGGDGCVETGVGDGGDGGRARRRRGGGEQSRAVYVESGQESGDETDDGWG